jgi:hypothetical protein
LNGEQSDQRLADRPGADDVNDVLLVISPDPAADCSSTIATHGQIRRRRKGDRQSQGISRLLRPAESGGGDRLTGTEVAPLRDGQVNLKDSYVSFDHNEAFLVGAHISPYSHGNLQNAIRSASASSAHRRGSTASAVVEKG